MEKKKFALVALAVLMLVGVGTAAVLAYFGQITANVNVKQGVLLDNTPGQAQITETFTEATAGNRICTNHNLTNQTNHPVTVQLSTSPIGGIAVGVFRAETQLYLFGKDSTTWQTTLFGAHGGLVFNTEGTTMNYTLSAEGLQNSTNYSLIYYADKGTRFENWGGDSPGALIGTGTSDDSGGLVINGLTTLPNLPAYPDWNIKPVPDYCNKNNTYDDYKHCAGAKIWLVPSADYDAGSKKLTAWNPNNYLFETDMVVQFDSAEGADDYMMGFGETELTIEPETTDGIIVCYDFADNIWGGQYTVITEVK